MKNLTILMLVTSIATTFVSCKKNDENRPAYSSPKITDKTMPGKWVGKYGYDNDAPDIYYCFQLKTDGTLEEWNSLNDKSGEGNWDLQNGTFKASTHFLPPYTSTFKLNSSLDTNSMTISGTWGYSPSTTNGGKFYLIKQQ